MIQSYPEIAGYLAPSLLEFAGNSGATNFSAAEAFSMFNLFLKSDNISFGDKIGEKRSVDVHFDEFLKLCIETMNQLELAKDTKPRFEEMIAALHSYCKIIKETHSQDQIVAKWKESVSKIIPLLIKIQYSLPTDPIDIKSREVIAMLGTDVAPIMEEVARKRKQRDQLKFSQKREKRAEKSRKLEEEGRSLLVDKKKVRIANIQKQTEKQKKEAVKSE
eukprot:TRINITY_DN10189_c0_g1_i1.p1 TRINITY_DN10189_c0_g1~~TRINITY_DN10189_c0_g1_i1.p1  ORF type:complete len:219 (-),score=119.97 TRINITY_DN10189_c0_g1_i1:148-804(-)